MAGHGRRSRALPGRRAALAVAASFVASTVLGTGGSAAAVADAPPAWEPAQTLATGTTSQLPHVVETGDGTSVVAWQGDGRCGPVSVAVRGPRDAGWTTFDGPRDVSSSTLLDGVGGRALLTWRSCGLDEIGVAPVTADGLGAAQTYAVPAEAPDVVVGSDQRSGVAVAWATVVAQRSTIHVVTHDPGRGWVALPTDEVVGAHDVEHVRRTDDGGAVVVTGWRLGIRSSTYADGTWTATTMRLLHHGIRLGPPLVASNPAGAVMIGWLEQYPGPGRYTVFSSYHRPGAPFQPPRVITIDRPCVDDLKPCVDLAMDRSGEAVVAWTAGTPDDVTRHVARRDAATGQWHASEVLQGVPDDAMPRVAAHPRGTAAVWFSGAEATGAAWVCREGRPCREAPVPGAENGMVLAAGPGGRATAVHWSCASSSSSDGGCVVDEIAASRFAR